MNAHRVIFFDLDHTLWDFDRNAEETISELLTEFAPHFDAAVDHDVFFKIYTATNRALWDAYERQTITMDDLRNRRWQTAFGHFGVATGEWTHEFGRQYVDRCPHKPHVMDGALDIVQRLSKEYRLGIISNGIESNQFVKLKGAGMLPYFDVVITGDMVSLPKPHPEIFQLGLQRANCRAENAIHVGDTYLADVEGAMSAGILPIFFNPENQPNPLGVHEINHLRKVPDLIQEIWPG